LRSDPILAGGRTAREPAALKAILDDRASHPPSARGYHYQLLSIFGWTSCHWLGRLLLPTLVLHSWDDPAVIAANGRFLASRIPNARRALHAPPCVPN
jgi:hypothetical protein